MRDGRDPPDRSGRFPTCESGWRAGWHGWRNAPDGKDRFPAAGRSSLSRRAFLRGSVAAIVCAHGGVSRAVPDFGDLAPPDFWATVSALQAHLFPPLPGTPSIADVNATAYFSAVLLDARIDGEERAFLAHGVGLLDAYVRRRFGRPFDALEESEREAALRAVEQSPTGQLWLSRMIYYVLEALLGDPIYGGNPGGVGWRWLEHEPGFPQPVRGWHGGAPADA